MSAKAKSDEVMMRLPEPGATWQMFGGVLSCESWEVTRHGEARVSIKMEFCFVGDAESYMRWMREQSGERQADAERLGV